MTLEDQFEKSACECERSSSMVLGPIMKLVNGPTVANAIGDASNDIVKLEAEIKDDDLLIEEVFLRFSLAIQLKRKSKLVS